MAEVPMKFSQAMQTRKFQNAMACTLEDPARIQRFSGAILSAVATNKELAECEPWSILTGAMTGETLGLSPSPQMGQYYLVPRAGKACFQLGFRGLVQLALRSGQYRRLNATELKQGELKSWNPLTEEITVDMIRDPSVRESLPSTGYVATMELVNGFTKTIYWSRERVEAHAKRYSAEYRAKGAKSAFWGQHFDEMALKTVLSQLLRKWGVMTADSPLMQAFEKEQDDVVDAPPPVVDNGTDPLEEQSDGLDFDAL